MRGGDAGCSGRANRWWMCAGGAAASSSQAGGASSTWIWAELETLPGRNHGSSALTAREGEQLIRQRREGGGGGFELRSR